MSAFSFLQGIPLNRLLHIFGAIMAICGITVVVVEGYYAFTKERQFARYFFDSCTLAAQTALNSKFATTQLLQKQMANYFITVNGNVSYSDFEAFSNSEFWKAEGLYAIQWIPKVLRADRAAFESSLTVPYSAKNNRTWYIGVFGPNSGATGKLDVDSQRDDYYPVGYVQPYKGNEIIVGYNTGQEFTTIRDYTQYSIVPRINLIQTQSNGFIGFLPLFKDANGKMSSTGTVAQQTAHIAAVYDSNILLKSAVGKLDLPLVDLYLFNHYGEFMAAYAGNNDGYFNKERLTSLGFTTFSMKNITGETVTEKKIDLTDTLKWDLLVVARPGFNNNLSTAIPIVVVVLTSLILLIDEIAIFLIRKRVNLDHKTSISNLYAPKQ